MKIMIISSKKYGNFSCFFDNEDSEIVTRYKWTIKESGYYLYAQCSAGLMHELLMPECRSHNDKNGLNNCRINLSRKPKERRFDFLPIRKKGYRYWIFVKKNKQIGWEFNRQMAKIRLFAAIQR